MPSDPLVNEPMLLAALKNVDHPRSTDEIRSLCAMTLLATYDRKVTREFMAETIGTVMDILYLLAEAERSGGMRHLLHHVDPERKPEHLDEDIRKTVAQLRHARTKLAEQFDLVTQCPRTTDKIS